MGGTIATLQMSSTYIDCGAPYLKAVLVNTGDVPLTSLALRALLLGTGGA